MAENVFIGFFELKANDESRATPFDYYHLSLFIMEVLRKIALFTFAG